MRYSNMYEEDRALWEKKGKENYMTDNQVKRANFLELIAKGIDINAALIEVDADMQVIYRWRGKYPKFKERMDNIISSMETKMYQIALRKIEELAGQGNIEALKVLVKQVQGSARKLGHSGSDVKTSNISIDASDNRSINLGSMLSNDTLDKLKMINPTGISKERVLEGVGEKED